VLVPWGRGQPGVAARGDSLGVAEVVPREDASVERIAAAVGRVLADEHMKVRARGHRDRLARPEVAGDLLEQLL
jgi:UDP:flavonoid glycosyltransferase YjiC (YdhE family)